jgi:signal transduction histidine kinase
MSNVIPFPNPASNVALDQAGTAFVLNPGAHAHAVQFYDCDTFLIETVGRFLGAGLEAGDRLIVIATEDHRRAFLHYLEPLDVHRAIERGQLTLVDARETLARFMVHDDPDPELFGDVIARLIADSEERFPGPRLRAYGEMVDLLWRDGSSRAAIRLEELWNDAGKVHSFSLLCAYVMGNFYREGDAARFLEVCRNHSHVMPTESFSRLDDAHARLREISFLQQRARSLETEIATRKELEAALRDALEERSRVEENLRVTLEREREARERAEANDAFKEVFLGILGHDLRNPLSTILTTARLMKTRGELPADDDRRIGRVISSGVRMQRMIEQILDVTRARLAEGIPVDRSRAHDVVQLSAKIVDELRGAHPTRSIVVEAVCPCMARVDADRMEQVISNLLGNAIVHGDPDFPITLRTEIRGETACISVHNFGKRIDPRVRATLFDPFKRGVEPQAAGAGLGLGLYIAERIVSAHGGTIEVHSSVVEGTRFEALFPVSA